MVDIISCNKLNFPLYVLNTKSSAEKFDKLSVLLLISLLVPLS